MKSIPASTPDSDARIVRATSAPPLDLNGVRVFAGLLDRARQEAMLEDLRAVLQTAPLYRPVTPGGRPMSVRMSAAGRFGWVSDRQGYRYSPRHPGGGAWPPIPGSILKVWHEVSGCARQPECCLINFYDRAARMGMHQDRDEADPTCPVVSISLGDAALFRVGGTSRGGPTASHWLASGDVVVLDGPARMAFHGIDRIRFASSALLARGGRINLTLRVVT